MIVPVVLGILFSAVIAVLILRSPDGEAIRRVGIAGSAGVFLALIVAVFRFNAAGGGSGWRMLSLEWIPSLGVGVRFNLDGLTLATVFCVAAVYLASFLSLKKESRSSRVVALLLSEAGVVAALTSRDLVFFLLMWSLSWLPLVLAASIETFNSDDSEATGKGTARVSIQLGAATAFFLCAALGLAAVYRAQAGEWTFDIDRIVETGLLSGSGMWMLMFFILSLGCGAAVFPFHSWLPYAARSLPVPILVVLMVGVTKPPLFMLVRLSLGVFPDVLHYSSPMLVIVAVFGVIHSGLLSWTHRSDMRRLTAYLTSGFHSMALFGFAGLDIRSISGASFLMGSHALAVATLVLGLTAVQTGRATERTPEFISRGWLVGVLLGVATLAAVPFMSGFTAEFLLWTGCFDSYAQHVVYSKSLGGAPLILQNPKLWSLMAVIASLLLTAGAVQAFYREFYLNYRRGFLSDDAGSSADRRRLPSPIVVLLPAVLSLLMGLYPRLLLKPMEAEAGRLIDDTVLNFQRRKAADKDTAYPHRAQGFTTDRETLDGKTGISSMSRRAP